VDESTLNEGDEILLKYQMRISYPSLHYRYFMHIRASLGKDEEPAVIKEAYKEMEGISIDYGVIEKIKNVLMVEGDFGWDDVGSWPSAAQYWTTDSDNR
jgi:mannose-1-phosphate guanylyltransferase